MAKPDSELGQLSVEQKTMGQMSVEQKRCRRRFLGQLSLGKFVWGKCRSIKLRGTWQVPPVTEENRVAFFSSDHRPSDVAGELLFFLLKGKYFCDVMFILQPY